MRSAFYDKRIRMPDRWNSCSNKNKSCKRFACLTNTDKLTTLVFSTAESKMYMDMGIWRITFL